MLIRAVHGYRGLVRELISRLKRELRCRRLPVVATGVSGSWRPGCRKSRVEPLLTLEGLRLTCERIFNLAAPWFMQKVCASWKTRLAAVPIIPGAGIAILPEILTAAEQRAVPPG
jgi:hypothetical protein